MSNNHVILAILHGNDGLITLACTTCILQLQNYLARQQQGDWAIHVHMFKDEEHLRKEISLLAYGQSSDSIQIPTSVPLDKIKVCVLPGEFGLDVEPFFRAITSDIPQGTALAFPYPLPHYNFKAALTDDTVTPQKALVYNVPNDDGVFPEQPRLYVCSLPTFVGADVTYKVFDEAIRITHTSPLAFVGCVGNRTGGSLR